MIVSNALTTQATWNRLTADGSTAISCRQLRHVTVSKIGTGTLTLYDGTAATGAPIGAIDLSKAGPTYFYGIGIGGTLTAVVSGSTSPDVIIVTTPA